VPTDRVSVPDRLVVRDSIAEVADIAERVADVRSIS
jgi:hypothetical protein